MKSGAIGLFALALILASCQTARPARSGVGKGPRAAADSVAVASAHGDTGDVDPAEVEREALNLFGSLEEVEAESEEILDEEVTWDIDVRSYETHSRVEFYVDRFKGSARDQFAVQVSRGTRYEPMIRPRLRAAGLPEDLTYIALIESGYDQHAYSRAAAVGMWQFMTTTARGVGLRVDWWVDERRDPLRSTEGAVRFLRQLHGQFGSLYLAAAAYNGGPGRVSRGLTRFADELDGAEGEDRFFALAQQRYLRLETRDYVPKLIAAAIVAKEPARYGLNVEQLSPFEYDSVRVGPSTPLAAVARAVGAERAEMLELNGHLIRGVTPPRDSFNVRVPVGRAEGFDSVFRALPEKERVGFTRATTRAGDTRAAVARRHGIQVLHLDTYNPGLRVVSGGALASGQTVLIPSADVIAYARNVPDPTIERYGSSVRGGRRTHVVRRGENLSVIARRYGTTVNQLMRLNGLKRSVIYPGQVIIVSSSGAAASAGAPSSGVHVVRSGETLTSIARRYGTSVAELKRKNGLSGDRIIVGQRLRI